MSFNLEHTKAVIKKLANGKFIEKPTGSVLLSFKINDNTAIDITCEDDKIYIHAGGTGPKKIIIEPIEQERIAIKIVNIPAIKCTGISND